jgi:hypothetical protein
VPGARLRRGVLSSQAKLVGGLKKGQKRWQSHVLALQAAGTLTTVLAGRACIDLKSTITIGRKELQQNNDPKPPKRPTNEARSFQFSCHKAELHTHTYTQPSN